MEAGLLYEPPFTDFNAAGLDGVFRDKEATGIVEILVQFAKPRLHNSSVSFNLIVDSENTKTTVPPHPSKCSGPACATNTKPTLDPQPSTERMKIMSNVNSATLCEETTHISNVLKRRAQSIIDDKSIDAETRAIIRYGLEINDPWLPDLVRSVDAGENIINNLYVNSSEEKMEALTEFDQSRRRRAFGSAARAALDARKLFTPEGACEFGKASGFHTLR